jgi:hypothetical protein
VPNEALTITDYLHSKSSRLIQFPLPSDSTVSLCHTSHRCNINSDSFSSGPPSAIAKAPMWAAQHFDTSDAACWSVSTLSRTDPKWNPQADLPFPQRQCMARYEHWRCLFPQKLASIAHRIQYHAMAHLSVPFTISSRASYLPFPFRKAQDSICYLNDSTDQYHQTFQLSLTTLSQYTTAVTELSLFRMRMQSSGWSI